MADPWGDIGDFLSKVASGAGNALHGAATGAGLGLLRGGGIATGALGGAILGGNAMDQILGSGRRPQYQRVQIKNPDGSTADAYYDLATGKTQRLEPGESFYDPTKPTKPTGFEEYMQHPQEFAQYGQALHPEAAAMVDLRRQGMQQSQKQHDEDRAQRAELANQANAREWAGVQSNYLLRDATLKNMESNQAQTREIARERENDVNASRFETASSKLADQRKNLIAMMSSKTPPPPQTMSAMLAQYNAQARTLGSKAGKYGADSSQFEPLQITSTPTTGMIADFKRHYLGADPMEPPTITGVPATLPATGIAGPNGSAAPAPFKAGDRRVKNGVTYERDEGGQWHPVQP